MDNHWLFKFVVYAVMVFIVFSLGSGLYFILFRKEKPEQAVKALTIRVGLSVFLFILLLSAFAMGWLRPHSLWPISLKTSKPTQTETTIPHRQNANTRQQLQKQNGWFH